MTSMRRQWMRRHLVAVIAATLMATAPGLVGGHQFSDWSAAVLEPGVNSAAADGCPIESPDGLRLFLASNREPVGDPTTDTNDIYVAERASVDEPFGAAVRLPAPVNSSAPDFCPTPLNGNRLLFVSARAIPGACGAGDMYVTRDHPVRGWETPVNLGCAATGAGPNTAGGEFSPSLVETAQGTVLFYSSPGVGGEQDIFVSHMRPDGTFAPGEPVVGPNLNLPDVNDQMPNVSRDGLEMVFVSDRGRPAGMFDIYVTTRPTTAHPWGTPEYLEEVNLDAAETRPSLSGDGQRLHFGRGGQIWVSTRSQITGNSN